MSYLESTLKLAHLLSHELPPWRSLDDESYRVYEMGIAISNQTYRELSEEDYRHGAWPAPSPDLLQALRAAMRSFQATDPGQLMASLLVRYGCRDSEVMSILHPWDRLGFHWQERQLTTEGIARLLGEAGLSLSPEPKSRALVEARLANPLQNFGDGFFPFSLLGERSVYGSLRDIGFEPPHHELFAGLCASVGEPVEESRQSCDRDECLMPTGEVLSGVPVYSSDGAGWVVSFRHSGEPYNFACQARGTWMDVPPVLAAFDRFMTHLDRPERAFMFEFGRGENGEHGAFVAAHGELFPPVAAELGLPLQQPTN